MRMQKKFYLYNSKTNSNTPLAPREVECIIYILRGKTSKQIAKVLALSHRTIEFYIGRLKTKLHCHTKSELIEKILSGSLINHGEPSGGELQFIREHQQIDSIVKQVSHFEKED